MKTAKKVFTKNDAVAMMHRHRAISLREISKHISKHDMRLDEICKLLDEIADEADAQAMVTDLRDTL